MLEPVYRNHFEKDLKLALKRGKDPEKIKQVISMLVNKESLPPRYRDHPLKGNYKGRRECHIEPDWLLIYKVDKNSIIFERTGAHTDLFE